MTSNYSSPLIRCSMFGHKVLHFENPIMSWNGMTQFVIGFFYGADMIDFLLCPEFDAVDTKILLLLHTIPKVLGSVNQKEVATAMGVSTATIERRLSRLKDIGAVDVKKTGSRSRKYDVPLLILSEANNLTNTDMYNRLSITGEGISSPSSQAVIRSISNIEETNKDLNVSSSSSDVSRSMLAMMDNFSEEEPMKFSGPKGKIADAISQASERTKKVHVEVREKRIARQKANADLSPESISTDRAARYEEYLSKAASEYNQTDFRFLFEDKWKERGWKSRPVRWTGKNAGQLKDMIKDQGAETIAQYFEYVFDNWDELKKRFVLNSSFPVLEVIYAFRKQWIPEVFDGPIKGRQNQITELNDVNYLTEEEIEEQRGFFQRLVSSSSDEQEESSVCDESKYEPSCDVIISNEKEKTDEEIKIVTNFGGPKKLHDPEEIERNKEERRRRFYKKKKVYGF